MSLSSTEYDYLIVGQGIAGTCMAWHLMEAGKKVLIINDPALPSASMVAAGIYNPLTGRKLVKTWMADSLFPYAVDFYSRLEKTLGAKFLYPTPIYRPYRSEEEKKAYLHYSSEPEISPYITQGVDNPTGIAGLNAPYGGLQVQGSGWVDLTSFIHKSREFFIEKGLYLESEFQETDLVIQDEVLQWKTVGVSKIILCQGNTALSNSFFDWLAFNPVKGQILDVTFEQYQAENIVNQGIFILPLPQKDLYRVGATYSWHDLNWDTTDDGREYLETRLKPLVQGAYTIHAQRAGLRPSSKDRRPFVGIHPVFRNIGVFNGLGTKGVTLAPFFANEFVQHLENGKELNPLVNIDRYFSLYYH